MNAAFVNCRFHKNADFSHIKCCDFVWFDKSKFLADTDFSYAKFNGYLGFENDNEVAHKLISKEILQSFIDAPEDTLKAVLKFLRSAFSELDPRYNLEKLSFCLESKEPLCAYDNNCIQRQIYNEILEDCNGNTELAKSKSMAGLPSSSSGINLKPVL